jgi:uncharacterized protein YbjT (DUF2867 family)
MTMMKQAVSLVLAGLLLTACSGDSGPPAHGSNDRVILVTGVTGTQGGAVASELLRRGHAVRGLTRNPDSKRATEMATTGVALVQGDFDDADSLLAAMDGAYGVFAVTDFWEHGYRKEVAHGKQLVDAAKAAGVQHFVFSSVASADIYTGIPHFESKGEIEAYLRDSGLGYSIVRPVEFMDNVRYDKSNIMSGVYFDPRDSGKSHQWIAASDIGFFVAEAFDDPDEWLGKALDIAGDEMTLAEFTEALSRAFGLDVHHQQITWTAFEKQFGEEIALMVRWFNDTGYSVDVEALRRRYPNLTTLPEYLQTLDWQ